MGEVYRAKDTQLKRDVAIKVLPDDLAHDSDRVSRFQREAEVLATLNHPNIAAVYGLERTADITAIVMELVEGETVAERFARGPIASNEALQIGRQIADALEAAHEKGIIHRDLKPANVKVTPAGVVKVLDFGLAAVAQESDVQATNATHSPTLTIGATRAGVILGTAAYMSPEQASGKLADKRADIWAFGVVLWEMLTGKPLFEGETISHTLAAVIMKEPDWTALPANTSSSIRTLLRRCLEKDRKRRLQAIGDARLEIDDALTTPAAGAGAPVVPVPRARWRAALPWAVTAMALLSFAAVLVRWAPWRTETAPSVVRVTAELGADASLAVPGAPGANLALSPDGERLAFAAGAITGASGASQLYLRRLDQLQATPLPSTDGARDPFWSPDGQWVAFFSAGKLKKISVNGGTAVTLCDAPNDRGGAWATDGTIVFAPTSTSGGLERVSDAGGKPEPVTKVAEGESLHRWPQIAPGGHVLFFASGSVGTFDDADIVAKRLPDGEQKIVYRGGYYGRYLPSGHLTFLRRGTLYAVPFDLDRLAVTGQPVPVLEGVNTGAGTGSAYLAVSENGRLVYSVGPVVGFDAPIVWMDREGETTPLRPAPSNWSNPSFSPDGSRLALDIAISGQPVVWILDLARDTLTRSTFGSGGGDFRPVWTSDGRRIAFSSVSKGRVANLYWQRADGTGDVLRLTEGPNTQIAGSWHPSGKFLAFHEQNPQTGFDIMILPIEGDEASGWKPGKPFAFLNSTFDEQDPHFSPDGRFLAYHSNETSLPEIYVRPFPSGVGKTQISSGGGLYPTWSSSRRELLYQTVSQQQIMVATYAVKGDSFTADKGRLWSPGRFQARPRLRSYDLHPDGNRLAVAPVLDAQAQTKQDKVVFVFNFFEELRRIAPPKR
jgi:serine/threonine-protein kinase